MAAADVAERRSTATTTAQNHGLQPLDGDALIKTTKADLRKMI